jgi:hypothetical protein
MTAKPPDPKSDAVIFTGASITQLSRIFGMDVRTVKGKIALVPPVGKSFQGMDLWRIRDVAPYLVKPMGDFEAALRNMSHEDLPPNLRKEFWHAKRQEQAYKKEAGELWPTEDVLAAFSEVFKELRTRMLLLGEAVEREVALPERAREILKGNIDATMGEMREALINAFGAPDPDAPPPVKEDVDADEFEGL